MNQVHVSIFRAAGLVHEDCITKMRLMSLVDLASHDTGRVPYALIKDTLRVICLFFLGFKRFCVLCLLNVAGFLAD